MLGISINGGRFEFGCKIGNGSFGTIYYGEDKQTGNKIAIKIESATNRVKQLEYEAKLYKVLGATHGLPAMHWYGTEQMCNIMVMDLLGPSLQDLFSFVGHRFSLKTVLQIATQTLDVLQYVHNRSFIHRDLKPQNILVGCGVNQTKIHLIDWGLAKRFRKGGNHIPFVQKDMRGMIGNARFGSLNAHKGRELSRRDDIEALCYILVYFLRGSLPWQQLDPPPETREEKNMRIGVMKEVMPIEEIAPGLPAALPTLLMLTRCLDFEEEPNYDLMRKVLRTTALADKIEFDGEFDWSQRCADGGEVDVMSEDARSCNNSQISIDSVPVADEICLEAGPLKRQIISDMSSATSEDVQGLARALVNAGITQGPVWEALEKSLAKSLADGDKKPSEVGSSKP